MLVGEVTDNPLGYHELVGSILGMDGEELNLVLLVDHAIDGEVAHLGVAILDLSACLGDIGHAEGAELVELGIGGRLMVALLVGSGKHATVGGYHIILQLAHGLELHAGDLMKRTACLAQGVLG